MQQEKIDIKNLATKDDLRQLEASLEARLEALEVRIDEKIDNKINGLRSEMYSGFREINRKLDIMMEQLASVTVKTVEHDDILLHHTAQIGNLDMRVKLIENTK